MITQTLHAELPGDTDVGAVEQFELDRGSESDSSWLTVAQILLVVQASIVLVSVAESVVTFSLGGFSSIPTIGLGVLGLCLTWLTVVRIERRHSKIRRLAIVLQIGWLVMAAVDLGLSVGLTQTGLGLVPMLTRVFLPIGVLRLLSGERGRSAFSLGPGRRARRRARRSLAGTGR